jgi:uncharacterized membrane protein
MGIIHIASAISSLVFGSLVLYLRKGTLKHRRAGYTYVASMSIMLISSFFIYRLFGHFGPFHVASIFSSIVTALGIIPIITRRPVEGWKFMHFNYMYWSVIGLYIALFAELLTRIPKTPFFGMVGVAFVLITGLGAYFFQKKKAKWKKIIGLR